ncbi:MAG: prepilin-type N-terminal cleavage/methylation domain-containing protein [Verrucomicrobiota bacterium]
MNLDHRIRSLRRRGHLERRNAFTLIELLVVIVIVGVLLGLVMVGTQSVLGKVYLTQSISNLRQVGVAVANYSTDNAGMLPGPCFTGIRPEYTKPRPGTAPREFGSFIAPYMGYEGVVGEYRVLTELYPATWEKRFGEYSLNNRITVFQSNDRDYIASVVPHRPMGYPGNGFPWQTGPLREVQISEPDKLWLIREAGVDMNGQIEHPTNDRRLFLWMSGRVSMESPDFFQYRPTSLK